jgi:hypothetical protein
MPGRLRLQGAALACLALLLIGGVAPSSSMRTESLPDMPSPAIDSALAFGTEWGALAELRAAGASPEYGVVWTGSWNLQLGWRQVREALVETAAQNATALIQFYYWGDHLSPTCLAAGCWTPAGWKSVADWERSADELVATVKLAWGEKPLVIIVESEFNKGSFRDVEPLDEAMAAIQARLKSQLPFALIGPGFGNWGREAWPLYDRTVANVDVVGLQGMRATTKDSVGRYRAVVDETVVGVGELSRMSGKPVLIADVALSSYPEPGGLALQANALRAFRDAEPALVAAGATTFVYRAYWDVPEAVEGHYFGPAEASWGLSWARNQNATAKPALHEWRAWLGVAVPA